MLCKRFVQQIQRTYGGIDEEDQDLSDNLEGPNDTAKADSDDYQSNQYHNKDSFSARSQSKISSKRRSFARSASAQSHSSSLSGQSITKLKVDRNQFLSSSAADSNSQTSKTSKDTLKARKRPVSTESLDRMYTFSLRKQGRKKEESKKPLKSDLKPELKADIGLVESKSRQAGLLYAETAEVTEPVAHGNKAIYVGESIKVLQSIILKADPVLNELCSLVKDF